MPTGYTAAIKDGISFEQFAMSCARAFGALIMMRDEPSDAEIPEQFQPSLYHQEKIEESMKLRASLLAMSDIDCIDAARKEYEDEIESRDKSIKESGELVEKYRAMLAKVHAWQSPSKDHDEMKRFMIEQIEGSIKFDDMTEFYTNKKIIPLIGEDWRKSKIAKASEDIAYHDKENLLEIQRTNSRNLWIKQLRESLGIAVLPTA